MVRRQTVADILRRLTTKYGSDFENLIFDGSSINPGIIVFVNGRAMVCENDWNSEISGGEMIRIALVSQAGRRLMPKREKHSGL